MTVIIDLPEKYSGVLAVTAIGGRPNGVDVTTAAMDLTKHNYARFDENGYIHCRTFLDVEYLFEPEAQDE